MSLRLMTRAAPRYTLAAVGASMLIGTGCGLGAGVLVVDDAVAEAAVRITPALGNAFSERTPNPLEDLATEAQVARSDAVLDDVVASPDAGYTVDQLRRRSRARVTPNTEVIVVSVSASSTARAEALAASLAESFISARTERAEIAASGQRAVLVPRVQAAQAELSAAVAVNGDTAEVRVLSRRLAVLRQELRNLVEVGADTGALVRVTTSPGSNQALVTATSAGVGGVVGLGIGVLFARARRGRTGAPNGSHPCAYPPGAPRGEGEPAPTEVKTAASAGTAPLGRA